MRLQAGCGKASPLKIYLWVLNYGCILPYSYFSAFPRFSLVSRIITSVVFKIHLKENMSQYLKYFYTKDLSKMWPKFLLSLSLLNPP